MTRSILTSVAAAAAALSPAVVAQSVITPSISVGGYFGGTYQWQPPATGNPTLVPDDPWVAFQVDLSPGWWVVLLFHGRATQSSIIDDYSFGPAEANVHTTLSEYLWQRANVQNDPVALDLSEVDPQLGLAVRPSILHDVLDRIFPIGSSTTDELKWSQPIKVNAGDNPGLNDPYSLTWVGEPPYQAQAPSAYTETWKQIDTTVIDVSGADSFDLHGMVDVAAIQQSGAILSEDDMQLGLSNQYLHVDVQAFAFRASLENAIGTGWYGQPASATPGLGVGGDIKIRVSDCRSMLIPVGRPTRGRNADYEPDLLAEVAAAPSQMLAITFGLITPGSTVRFQLEGGGYKDQPIVKVAPRVGLVRAPFNVADNFFLNFSNAYGVLDGASVPASYGPMLFRRL